MTGRQSVSTGTPWENSVGYSRAVRTGNHVYVSGTVASDANGTVISPGDPGAQASYIINKIGNALAELGASLESVVRTRMYVTNMESAGEVGKAHQSAFGDVRPASTLVEVSRLADPAHLVEIEADAVADAVIG